MSELICPITHDIIDIKFYLQCGHVFEKEAILPWIQEHKNCPMCRKEHMIVYIDPFIEKFEKLMWQEYLSREQIILNKIIDFKKFTELNLSKATVVKSLNINDHISVSKIRKTLIDQPVYKVYKESDNYYNCCCIFHAGAGSYLSYLGEAHPYDKRMQSYYKRIKKNKLYYKF